MTVKDGVRHEGLFTLGRGEGERRRSKQRSILYYAIY